MADVGEPGAFGRELGDEAQSLFQVHVHRVFAVVQGTRYQVFCSKNFFFFNVGNGFHVGQISQIAEAETQNRNVAVQDFDGLDFDLPNAKRRVFINFNQFDARRAGDGRAENIFESSPNLLGHAWQGVNSNWPPGAKVKRANIVEADDVVVVFVREQNAGDVVCASAQHLLAQVGAGVYKYKGVVGSEQGSRAQAVVARVRGLAHLAVAPDDGDALRSAGAEKCEFQSDS